MIVCKQRTTHGCDIRYESVMQRGCYIREEWVKEGKSNTNIQSLCKFLCESVCEDNNLNETEIIFCINYKSIIIPSFQAYLNNHLKLVLRFHTEDG